MEILDTWILSKKGLQYEREEFKKRNVPVKDFFWKDIIAPMQECPDVARWMLDPVHMVFQLSFIEDLERRGCRVINSPAAVMKCDKASMVFLWRKYLKNDVKMPISIITSNRDAAMTFINDHESVVAKALDGQGGQQVIFVNAGKDHPTIKKWLDGGKFILFQEYILNRDFEIRTILVGDDHLIQYARYNEGGAHNYAQGGIALDLSDPRVQVGEPTLDMMKEATRKIAMKTGLDMVAVDMMPDTKGIPWLIEWNPCFTYNATIPLGLDIPSKIVDFILK